jgi:phosphatidylglycerol:prolipoprotein diacylglycerol transferase
MFINNINPVLISLGPVNIRYYGLIYFLGFIITYLLLRLAIKNNKLKITNDQLDLYFAWLMIGSILGARIFEVLIYNFEYYINNLSEIYKIWNGGLSFQGGIIGAVLVTLIFCKKYKVHFYDLADLLVIPATLTLAFGKLANYTNSELYGTITNSINTPWCVIFQKVDNYCRHPAQIYEFFANIIMFATLLSYKMYATKKNENYKKGTLFWIFIIMYSILRLLLTFFRDELQYGGLNVGQWTSIITIIIAIMFLVSIHRHNTIKAKR